MKIEQIRIKNYKVFHDVVIKDLPSMCVFLGSNGSGKTTLFDVFGFLSDSLKNNVKIAINKRGGYSEVVSRNQKGNIEFEIKFRNIPEKKNKKPPIITYELVIGLDKNNPIVIKETLKYRRGQKGQPWKFLDFAKGKGEAITNEEEYGITGVKVKREGQSLDSPDILAIKGLGQFQKFKAIAAFRRLLESWFVSNFHINVAKQTQDLGLSEHLSTEGENLALVAQYMFQNHRQKFDELLDKMKKRVPGISNVEATETEDGRIVLKFQDGAFKDPFIARYVSDGTIKMFAYLLLLHDPNPHPLLCIEEPENYLHPKLLHELAEEFREYAYKGGQVFISTHSPDFVNALKIEELFWIEKKGGYSKIHRALEDKTVKSLFDNGDHLGYLWNQNFLKGSSPR